ncbi:hypothetical protein AXG93_4022s1170 [Marchantia polymorpha subsp. ruderalis]|uniref:HECT-type E3 ubiquitin transferase n=2 Tax=Marchantia polymorpha TaxID=3197 RepID=A0A176W0W9_MARPO|nr:hypothetical protein AXG93_4022s1170 [Marchantia polymorpha subsp. ruderalis]
MEELGHAKVSSNYGELLRMIRATFSSANALSKCFLPSNGSGSGRETSVPNHAKSTILVAGVDLALLKRFYDAVIELETGEVKSAIMESSDKLLTDLLLSVDPKNGTRHLEPTPVIRTIIALLENRLFKSPDYHNVLTKLWKLILNLPSNCKTILLQALEKYSKEHLEQLVSIVQTFITSNVGSDQVVIGVDVLREIYAVNEKSQHLSFTSFYNDAVNNDEFDLKEDFRRWRNPDRFPFSFCKYPFIYDPSSKSKILQLDANVQMRHEFQDAVLRSIFIGATCPYLVLRVNRENLIRETIFQIQQQSDDLKKPLKVQFLGEEGVDEGGVQKEFFQLVVREVFDPKYGMFSYNEETRCFWFNSSPLDMDTEYELVGILLGLAIYNGHILELHFPSVIYKKLLNKTPTFEDLAEVNPILAKGLEQLLSFTGDVEAVFLRSFQVSVQDIFGDIRTVDLKNDGGMIPVTQGNRKEYVDLCVEYYMELSIQRAFEAFKHGFQKLCKGNVLDLFQPVELEQLICGSPELDFEALERNTLYEDGYRKDSKVISDFWEVVHSLDEENKKRLLFFVTGCDRAPIKGLANLHFVISRNGTDSERLPTAHTCFNHLLLPEYSSKGKLRERLMTAISNAEGFGLM